LNSLKNLVSSESSPLILFTHIPDLVDPYEKGKDPSRTRSSWDINPDTRKIWEDLASKIKIPGIFAGHFHSNNKTIYGTNVGTTPLFVNAGIGEKTWVAPPLAGKNQRDGKPQARGFLLATITNTGAVRADVHWYFAGSEGERRKGSWNWALVPLLATVLAVLYGSWRSRYWLMNLLGGKPKVDTTKVDTTSGQPPSSEDPAGLEARLKDKLKAALKLKDYAINARLPVDDSIIERLNKANSSKSPLLYDENAPSDLDKALRDLTTITYPTTAETLDASEGPGGLSDSARKFMFRLLVLASVVLAVALVAVWRYHADKNPLWQSVTAACLGLLGSAIYIFFNLIGVLAEKAFSPNDTYSNSVRLVLGAILG